jgi:predicted DNA-binding transcriptional regulator YafY
MAALPPELRSRASRLVQRFHLDAAGWFQTSEPVPHLGTLAAAVWESRLVRIVYRRGQEEVERTVAPLGVVLKGGIWYVVASIEGQIRTYRASRVVDATALEETIERPDDFDLAAYWSESTAAYERDAPTIDVDVRIAEDRLWRISNVFGQGVVDRAPRSADPDQAGQLRLRLTLDYPEDVPGLLLAVGPNLEVLGPPEIRERVVKLAGLVAERYRETAPLEAGR